MDSNFWTSRLAAAKRQFHHQHHQFNYGTTDGLNLDDFELEEEVKTDVPCPYCYEDFDIGSLCTHLEDEHPSPSESEPTVCPVCFVKVCGDLLSHITLQHGHLFKIQRRRRLLRRAAVSNNNPTAATLPLLREAHLQILLGGGGGGGGFRPNTTLNDPFLSSLVLNLPATEPHPTSLTSTSALASEELSLNNNIRPQPQAWKPSLDPCLSSEERKRMIKQASGRAGFVQDLLLCTFLEED